MFGTDCISIRYCLKKVQSVGYGESSFAKAGPKLWNQLPNNIKHCSDIASFKCALKTYLFREAFGNEND